jgi:hypothetical protein
MLIYLVRSYKVVLRIVHFDLLAVYRLIDIFVRCFFLVGKNSQEKEYTSKFNYDINPYNFIFTSDTGVTVILFLLRQSYSIWRSLNRNINNKAVFIIDAGLGGV